MFAAVNSWIDSPQGRTWLLAGGAALYLLAYLGHGALPGNNAAQPLGWNGWWDQSQYAKCAAELAHGRLSRETYWYPLGYPLLGALFQRWTPQHAFFLPNFLCVLGIAEAFYQIARKVISPLEAILLMLALLFFYREVAANSLVVPWNTIPTQLLSYAIILLVGFGQKNSRQIVAAVFCVGLMYLCRPVDAFCLALLPALAILRLPHWREKFRLGAVALFILLLFRGSILLVNHAVFQSSATAYEKMIEGIGFASYPLMQKVYLLFVDGNPVFQHPESALLPRFPWLLFVIPGAFCLARRLGKWSLGVTASIAVTYGIYIAFNDFWPSNVIKFHLIHYLFWTLPLLALLAYLAVKDAWRLRTGRWLLACSIFLGLAWWSVRLVPVSNTPIINLASGSEISASSAEPIDWIVFKGETVAPRLEQNGRVLNQFSDFMAETRSDGVAVFLARKAREKPIRFTLQGEAHSPAVESGRLRWGWR